MPPPFSPAPFPPALNRNDALPLAHVAAGSLGYTAALGSRVATGATGQGEPATPGQEVVLRAGDGHFEQRETASAVHNVGSEDGTVRPPAPGPTEGCAAGTGTPAAGTPAW